MKEMRFLKPKNLFVIIILFAVFLGFSATALGEVHSNYDGSIASYQDFRDGTNNTDGYDADGRWGRQCWDGVQILYLRLGMSLSTGNVWGYDDDGKYVRFGYAKYCWDETARSTNTGTLFTQITRIEDVKRGDIIVFSGPTSTGHIAFADEDYNPSKNTIAVWGQNQEYHYSSYWKCYEWYFTSAEWNNSYFLGAFRYKGWAKYKVVLDPNGGEGDPVTIEKDASESFILSAKTVSFTKEGYYIHHWSTAPDDSGTKYCNKNDLKGLNTTLYAIWYDKTPPKIEGIVYGKDIAYNHLTLSFKATDNIGIAEVNAFVNATIAPNNVKGAVGTYDRDSQMASIYIDFDKMGLRSSRYDVTIRVYDTAGNFQFYKITDPISPYIINTADKGIYKASGDNVSVYSSPTASGKFNGTSQITKTVNKGFQIDSAGSITADGTTWLVTEDRVYYVKKDDFSKTALSVIWDKITDAFIYLFGQKVYAVEGPFDAVPLNGSLGSFYSSPETADPESDDDEPGEDNDMGYTFTIKNGEAGYGVYLKTYSGNESEVYIPSRIGDVPVVSIEDQCFANNDYIVTVHIPDSVVTIGKDAFGACDHLTYVDIPEGIRSIGESAFFGSNLKKVKIPEGVTSINASTFLWCYNLSSITIPESVTNIGRDAFHSCRSLTSIIVPNGVTSIGAGAFNRCQSLTSFTIPEGVTQISYGTFEQCSRLISIDIPSNVTSIGERAFYGCTSLKHITLPDGITSIEEYSFSGCSSLHTLNIPESVTIIGDYAFLDCSSLLSLILPDGVTSIGRYAFYRCSSLTEINIPSGVTIISPYAFGYCKSLMNIVIPDGITGIGAEAFINCSNISHFRIPEHVQNIGATAFSGCTDIVEIIIPESVENIGSGAFNGCKNLKEVFILGRNTRIDYFEEYEIFDDSNSDVIIYGWKDSPAEAYANRTGITFIPLDDLPPREFIITYDLNIVGTVDIWYYAPSSQTVTEGSVVLSELDTNPIAWKTWVGTGGPDPLSHTFMGWSRYKNAEIPEYQPGDTYTGYEDVTLYAVWEIKEFTLTLNLLGTDAHPISGEANNEYVKAKWMEVVDIPKPHQEGYMFLGWKKRSGSSYLDYTESTWTANGNLTLYAVWVKSNILSLPSSLKVIEESAFEDNSATVIVIPKSVTQIQSRAFAGNDKLYFVTIYSYDAIIAKDAFADCVNLKIRGYNHSTAYWYAIENGIPFEEIGE